MKQCCTILSVLLTLCFSLAADSLIPPDFSGYLNAGGSLKPGNLVRVVIDTQSKISYSAASSDDSMVSLRFTGGEGDGLFNFLPAGSSGSQSTAESREEALFETRLSGRVVDTDEEGNFFIRGSRELRVDRGVQRITIEGWGDISSIDNEGSISFNDLADSVLIFSSFLEGSDPLIGEGDLVEIELPTPEEEEIPEDIPVIDDGPVEDTPEEDVEAAEAAGTVPPEEEPGFRGYELSEEARRRLLLQYINRMVDLLFGGSEG